MNISGKEFRIRKIWCEKHHLNDHWIFFIKRDYERKGTSRIPFVYYSAICHECYEADFKLKQNQQIVLGKKFDENRYAFDSVVLTAYENDWQALWNVNFY